MERAGSFCSRDWDDDCELACTGAELIDGDDDCWSPSGLFAPLNWAQVAKPHLALVGVGDVHAAGVRPSPAAASQAATSLRCVAQAAGFAFNRS